MAFLTQKSFNRLTEELMHRKNVLMPELKVEYDKAMEAGETADDNFLLKSAKFDIERNDQRIEELEQIVKESKIHETKKMTDKISIGSSLELHDTIQDQVKTITLVDTHDIEETTNPVSIESPLGKILLGKVINEIIDFITPTGTKKRFKILKIL